MVAGFNLLRTPRIYFGWKQSEKVLGLLDRYGKRVLLVTGATSYTRNQGITEIISSLEKAGRIVHHARIESEPSPDDVDTTAQACRDKDPDLVLSIGGGSVIDTGKALSAMLPIQDSIRDYLEGVGTKKHTGEKKFFVAIPTTSGTGSEATANAVISFTGKNGFKRSLRHENLVPDMAIVDPQLTVSCSPQITGASGMDAFTQLVESYLSVKANALTDALALEGISQIHKNLLKAVLHGDDSEARTGMSLAALLSGITLANAGLGLIHGFASSVGGLHDIPHGTVCGTLMGVVNRYQVSALLKLPEVTPAHDKYEKLGRLFSGAEGKSPGWYMEYAVEYIETLTGQLNLKRLGDFGVQESNLMTIAEITDHKSNPVHFEKELLVEMMKERL